MHRVFATDASGTTYVVSDNLSWGQAQYAWRVLDDLRLAGRMPHVRHFEVRSNADQQPRFRDAKLNMLLVRPVVKGSRGFADDRYFAGRRSFERTGLEKVASKAWRLFSDKPSAGGWFYWPNGRPACQGLRDLGKLCERKGLVVKGVDQKWYVVDNDFDSDKLQLRALSRRAA